jgi:drug/metabolite transporter (DMT)-like permease
MGFAAGVAWSLAGACVHTASDALRKVLSSRGFGPSDVVAGVAVLDALVAPAMALLLELAASAPGAPAAPPAAAASSPPSYAAAAATRGAYVLIAVASSALMLASKLLYQAALAAAPLSLTVPYLAFTPALVALAAFVFLGERPPAAGLAGVAVVALGGFWLGSLGSGGEAVAAAEVGVFGGGGGGGARRGAGALATTATTKTTTTRPKAKRSGGGGVGSTGAAPLPTSTPPASWEEDGGGGGKHDAKRGLKSPAAMMLAVAAAWSATATLDKAGVGRAPSVAAYFLAQRLSGGLGCALLLWRTARLAPLAGRVVGTGGGGEEEDDEQELEEDEQQQHGKKDGGGPFPPIPIDLSLMLSVCVVEQLAVAFFLFAVAHLLVSYVIALKRLQLLLSAAVGAVFFGERVGARLPPILAMVAGMVIIVLHPH